MDLTRYESMDPHLLFGLVNTGMRNASEDLESFCKTHSIDKDKLCSRLAEAGYEYNKEVGQFR